MLNVPMSEMVGHQGCYDFRFKPNKGNLGRNDTLKFEILPPETAEAVLGLDGFETAYRRPWGMAPEAGFFAGTLLATDRGWVAVEDITEGDCVLTFDHGLQPVVGVRHAALWSNPAHCPVTLMPVEVPAGVFGNREPLLLLPGQGVLVESDLAEELCGDPFTMVPAAALEGFAGIHRVEPATLVDIVMLELPQNEVVYANGATLMQCGLGSDTIGQLLGDEKAYPLISMDLATAIVSHFEDAGGFGGAGDVARAY